VLERRIPPRRRERLICLRARDLRDLTDDELELKLHDTRQELFNLRFQGATGALENSARLKLAKREIARILTVRNEREAEASRNG
jgi:large subunit ribosomal protein L29